MGCDLKRRRTCRCIVVFFHFLRGGEDVIYQVARSRRLTAHQLTAYRGKALNLGLRQSLIDGSGIVRWDVPRQKLPCLRRPLFDCFVSILFAAATREVATESSPSLQ